MARFTPVFRRVAAEVSRMYWTPPLSPRQAWLLEKLQIENVLDLNPLVSLSDHDNLEAPLRLRVLEETRNLPISVEWTVPFGDTFFHLGVHNMPWLATRSLFAEMVSCTAQPRDNKLAELLRELGGSPATLIVLNHPLWDEKGIGGSSHRWCLMRFLSRFRPHVHALEWNGFRPVPENSRIMRMGAELGMPVISGGDRHGKESNSVLNLTRASSFDEFAGEIRDGVSEILVMPQQRQPLTLRVLRTLFDALRDDPGHGFGWSRWSDRVFHRAADGTVRPVSSYKGDEPFVRALAHGSLPRARSGQRAVASIRALNRLGRRVAADTPRRPKSF
jgi:hypothetical protein